MPVCVPKMIGQPGFDNGRVGSEQIPKLIRDPWERSSHGAGRKFVQMHGDDSPRALHHELHGKPADDKEREAWRENPERNKNYSKRSSENDRATAAPFLREMANHCSAADCANSVDDPTRGLLRHVIVTLFTEKSLIHILGPMRHGVERRHQ